MKYSGFWPWGENQTSRAVALPAKGGANGATLHEPRRGECTARQAPRKARQDPRTARQSLDAVRQRHTGPPLPAHISAYAFPPARTEKSTNNHFFQQQNLEQSQKCGARMAVVPPSHMPIIKGGFSAVPTTLVNTMVKRRS